MSDVGVQKGYHWACQIHYHILFQVKYRKTLIGDEVKAVISETEEAIADRYAITMESIGCDKDYIHLLCGAHPKMAPDKDSPEENNPAESCRVMHWGITFYTM